MKSAKFRSTLLAAAAVLLPASIASAFPIDPAKLPVTIRPQDAALVDGYVLAYDNLNPNVIYYAPKTGRTATLNGFPLFGFVILGNGQGFFNAQMELGVFGASQADVFQAIQNVGKTPVQFPYRRTKVYPLTPGFDQTTGQPVCVQEPDPSTGGTYEVCQPTMFTEVTYSQQGPSLNENIAISGSLNPLGASQFNRYLTNGVALMVNLEAEYFAAGVAFEAVVRVSYDKLFENFRSYASFHGFFCTDIQVSAFFQNETTCLGRRPEDCGVWVEYRNLINGQVVQTGAIDPNDQQTQENVRQAADRLAQSLRDQMLTPITTALGPFDMSRPNGFKLNVQYERQKRGLNATFNFRSPNSVNVNTTTVPLALACVRMAQDGSISRSTAGDCSLYWQ